MQIGEQSVFIRIGCNCPAERVMLLRHPAFKTDGRPRITGPIPKGRQPAGQCRPPDTPNHNKCATTGLKTPQQRLSVMLALERMAKHNVAVAQGSFVFWQLFEAKDHRVIRGVWPSVFRRDGASGSAVHPSRSIARWALCSTVT